MIYDNDRWSLTYRTSIGQLVYQLEPQDRRRRAHQCPVPGNATATDPRQGRNIGVSAISRSTTRSFWSSNATTAASALTTPPAHGRSEQAGLQDRHHRGHRRHQGDTAPSTLPASIIPVTKSPVFIDLAADTVLPNEKLAEKWEGLTIGPRLRNGGHLILAGNDNDYSVTQTGEGEQFDVYVDFAGNVAKCVLDSRTLCEVNPDPDDLVIDNPVPLPHGYVLFPGFFTPTGLRRPTSKAMSSRDARNSTTGTAATGIGTIRILAMNWASSLPR